MSVIPLSPFHAELVAAIHAKAFEEHWTLNEFASLISLPASFGFLYEKEDKPLGFILCQGDEMESEIITIASHPKARRCGVGHSLLQAAFDKTTSLFLEVAEDNTIARNFYQKEGFLQVGLRKKYYKRARQEAVNALVLRLSTADE